MTVAGRRALLRPRMVVGGTCTLAFQEAQLTRRELRSTGMQDNALARISDILLHTVADEDNFRSSSITVRDAQLALLDLLFLMIVQNQPSAQMFIKESEAAVKALKVH